MADAKRQKKEHASNCRPGAVAIPTPATTSIATRWSRSTSRRTARRAPTRNQNSGVGNSDTRVGLGLLRQRLAQALPAVPHMTDDLHASPDRSPLMTPPLQGLHGHSERGCGLGGGQDPPNRGRLPADRGRASRVCIWSASFSVSFTGGRGLAAQDMRRTDSTIGRGKDANVCPTVFDAPSADPNRARASASRATDPVAIGERLLPTEGRWG